MAQIVIIDYGMANLRSVQKAFQATGHAAEITADPERIANATKVVLPGVGALRDAIHGLRETHLADAVLDHIHDGLPFLGICLGMQMLFTRGHEDGLHPCLDVIPGEVIRFPRVPGLKVPHM
ncbi:MAG: imidazole glycerol phosphate synthase subunit HisH, partial [Gemmataceae bacterium]